MDADSGRSRMGLPALALSISASLQLNAQQLHPEPPSTFGIIGGELDQ